MSFYHDKTTLPCRKNAKILQWFSLWLLVQQIEKELTSSQKRQQGILLETFLVVGDDDIALSCQGTLILHHVLKVADRAYFEKQSFNV